MKKTYKLLLNIISIGLLIAISFGAFSAKDRNDVEAAQKEINAYEESEKKSEEKNEQQNAQMEESEISKDEAFVFCSKLVAGINIGNSLDCYSGHQLEYYSDYEAYWGNPPISKEYILSIKRSGFNMVKFPVTWDQHILEDGVTIDPYWINRVKEVVNYAYDEGMYVIIDVHHDKWKTTTELKSDTAKQMTTIIWKQIADAFKDYDEHLIFDGFNELRNIGEEDEFKIGGEDQLKVVDELNDLFVKTVRSTGGNNTSRYLMISPYVNSADSASLDHLLIPSDNHLIVSIHFYTPYKFTGNDSKEGDVRTWDETIEMTRTMDKMFANLGEFIKEKNIPVVITEMGASYKDNQQSRLLWTRYVVNHFNEMNIPYIWWDDNYEPGMYSYGLYDRINNTEAYSDIIDILLNR